LNGEEQNNSNHQGGNETAFPHVESIISGLALAI